MINNGELSAADLAAIVGNNNDGFGGNNGAWWLLILLLFANGGWGGWGNNGNNGGCQGQGCMIPQYMMNFATNDTVQNGFNQMALSNGLGDITSAVSNGFSNAEISRANALATLTAQMNNNAMNQQQNYFNGQLQIAQMGAQIAQEACADRQAVNDGVRDLMAQNVSNTNALLNTMNNGIQSLKDQISQYRDQQKDETIANLRQQLAMKDLQASQTAQNLLINQDFVDSMEAFYNRLSNCPIPSTPVYGRTPIFNCNGGQYQGCGCGGN